MSIKRYSIEVKGLSEGVGFRPFVYRVCKQLGLSGWVRNDSSGVYIQVEGTKDKIDAFINIILTSPPRASEIYSIKAQEIEVLGESEFNILPSTQGVQKLPIIPPDISVCEDCRRELFDSKDKRFLYPFINCTDCGPRFSIIEDIPYDRHNTSMRDFDMCEFCRSEYEDVSNRRFHAQPVACFECGPHLELLNSSLRNLLGDYPEKENERREYTAKVIREASRLILEGNIVAIKGIGGFQIVCRADSDDIIRELRKRKRREEKPFAVMFRSLEDIEKYCYVSEVEKKYLVSYITPIVLLRRKQEIDISELVAPRNPFLGCILPYTPLHILIMEEVKVPVVFTSGNISDEPICIDNEEAFERLKGIADYFLIHNRRIVRHVDDSVIRITSDGNTILIRRARGFVPKPLILDKPLSTAVGVGGHLKNTVAISVDRYIVMSQHIGDLETLESIKAFERSVKDLTKFYSIEPEYTVCDLHPDYVSTQFAEKNGRKVVKVQHHFAHILSVMGENGIIDQDVIGVAWDGTGYGTDGEIWGSEFIFVSKGDFRRVFHFLPIPLIGGEIAIKETWRIGVALLIMSSLDEAVFEIYGDNPEVRNVVNLFRRGYFVNSSGAGRLFDGVSSILGISNYSKFEGQSAMGLEFALYDVSQFSDDTYQFDLKGEIIDWRKIILGIYQDLKENIPKEVISLKFHNTLVKIIWKCVSEMSKMFGCRNVALSGGVFQNGYLLDKTIRALKSDGFEVFTNQRVPPNDGGISFGQIVYLALKNNF